MKIDRVEIWKLDLDLRAPFRLATMVAESLRSLMIRLTTDDGFSGWGEACPLHAVTGETVGICAAAVRDLAPRFLGRNPLDAIALARDAERFLPHNATARSAFDMAIHDLVAQSAHQPLHRYFHGVNRRIETSVTITHADATTAAALATEAVRKGYRALKIRIGWDPVEDHLRLAKISLAVGNQVPLRLDANQGYADAEAALAALKKFAEFNVEFCEQPVPAGDVNGMKKVTESSPFRIMADEALFTSRDATRLAEEHACDLFNVKLSKAGGLEEAAMIARIATQAGIPCMMGCALETRLGLTAAAHLAVAFPIFHYVDLAGSFDHAHDAVIGGIRMNPPQVILPEAPGLGATYPDEENAAMQKILELPYPRITPRV